MYRQYSLQAGAYRSPCWGSGSCHHWEKNMTRMSSVQSLNHVQLFAGAAHQASLSITNSQSLLKLMSTELVMPCNHLILCHPLLFRLQSFPASGFFPVSQLYASSGPSTGHLSFSLSISPSNEYSGLISFRMDWFDLLTVQGTLKSLLQHHSSKASVLQCSAFFMVRLSHPYMTTEKTIALTMLANNVSAF